jgi:microcystin-dependent protein
MAAEPILGSIHVFGFQFAPVNYAYCNGALLNVSQNTALFSLLGTTYGGNGVNTFGLPDLRGRVPNGQGQGPGLQIYSIGQIGGTETTTLTQLQMPQHTHAFTGSGTLNAVQTKGSAQIPENGSLLSRPTLQSGNDIPQIYVPAGTAGDLIPLGGLNVAGTIGVAGGSQPFSNMQPYLTMNYCIATSGIFPSRN